MTESESEIQDKLDEIAVQLWVCDDNKDPYTGDTREHYRNLARTAVESLRTLPWDWFEDNASRLGWKRLSLQRIEDFKQAYVGVLDCVIKKSFKKPSDIPPSKKDKQFWNI